MPVLHVMSDGFPAAELTLDYHVRLTPVIGQPQAVGPPMSAREAIREQRGDALLRQAVEEVFAALQVIPTGQQVILFVQDKIFLRTVSHLLVHPEQLGADDQPQEPIDTGNVVVEEADIGLLDGSVPEWKRRQLLEPEVKISRVGPLLPCPGSRRWMPCRCAPRRPVA